MVPVSGDQHSGLAILPSGVIGVRASMGSQDAAGIFFPTWFASGCATIVGVGAALLLARLARYRATEPPTLTPGETGGADQASIKNELTPSDEARARRRGRHETALARLGDVAILARVPILAGSPPVGLISHGVAGRPHP